MIDILGHREFGALVVDLGWPAVRLGQRMIESIEWDEVLPRLTRPDRRALVTRLWRHVLVASEGGRARLRGWLDDRPAPRSLEASIHLFGDLACLPLIAHAVATLPLYVRDTVAEEVAFVTVGRGTHAWCGSTELHDHITGRRLAQQIVAGPTTTLRVVLHEIGHAWCARLPGASQSAMTAQGEAAFKAYAAASGLSRRFDPLLEMSERYAEALAVAWEARAELRH